MDRYHFRACSADACGLRFPAGLDQPGQELCPRCGAVTHVVEQRPPAENPAVFPAATPGFSALLDNIRSIHNVGSMFRTADGAGIAILHLAGITATPEHPKLAKAALGAEDRVAWTYTPNAIDLALRLKREGHTLVALEATPEARPLFAARAPEANMSLVLVVGNERAGVDPGILRLCHCVVCLPMHGVKRSLNVAVAFGIAAYHLRFAAALAAEGRG